MRGIPRGERGECRKRLGPIRLNFDSEFASQRVVQLAHYSQLKLLTYMPNCERQTKSGGNRETRSCCFYKKYCIFHFFSQTASQDGFLCRGIMQRELRSFWETIVCHINNAAGPDKWSRLFREANQAARQPALPPRSAPPSTDLDFRTSAASIDGWSYRRRAPSFPTSKSR